MSALSRMFTHWSETKHNVGVEPTSFWVYQPAIIGNWEILQHLKWSVVCRLSFGLNLLFWDQRVQVPWAAHLEEERMSFITKIFYTVTSLIVAERIVLLLCEEVLLNLNRTALPMQQSPAHIFGYNESDKTLRGVLELIRSDQCNW